MEGHTFEIGILIGLIISGLVNFGYIRTSLGLLSLFVILALTVPAQNDLCGPSSLLCMTESVKLKPWYAVSGLVGDVIAVSGVGHLILGERHIYVPRSMFDELTELVRDLGPGTSLADAVGYLPSEYQKGDSDGEDNGETTDDAESTSESSFPA